MFITCTFAVHTLVVPRPLAPLASIASIASCRAVVRAEKLAVAVGTSRAAIRPLKSIVSRASPISVICCSVLASRMLRVDKSTLSVSI